MDGLGDKVPSNPVRFTPLGEDPQQTQNRLRLLLCSAYGSRLSCCQSQLSRPVETMSGPPEYPYSWEEKHLP